jgi:hypothetical protein
MSCTRSCVFQAAEVEPVDSHAIAIMLNVMRMKQHMGLPQLKSADAALQHARHCIELFIKWQPVICAGADTDLGAGEDVISHAVDALMAAYALKPDMTIILQMRPDALCEGR